MNYKKIFKRETKVIAYVVISLTIVVIGVSYAMFLQVNKNSDNQIVEAGSLVITYKNGNGETVGNGDIVTSSACLEPMSDEEASSIANCAYKLNILNTGSLPARYKLIVYNNVSELTGGKTSVDHSLIRMGIKKGNDTLSLVGNYTLSELTHTPETASETAQNKIHYILDEGVLEAGSDITYSVQAWLNEALSTGAVSGQYVYLKLDVNSIVAEDTPVTPTLAMDTIKSITPVTTGTGIYQVTHEDADITYTTDTTAINNLKMTELRYAGSNPNNYVSFNKELWRIIGLVNTPEGQRIKIIRNEGIGDYSWDSSEASVNSGQGVNEWSQADAMKLLNSGYESESVGGSLYWNHGNGTCYKGPNNATTPCDFRTTGLKEEAQNMIDTITWNIASNKMSAGYYHHSMNIMQFYDQERSNGTEHSCDGTSSCNDTVTRTTTWQGEVGLMYPSDYGYATSGGSVTNRITCLSNALANWNNTTYVSSDCKNNDWILMPTSHQFTITTITYAHLPYIVIGIEKTGSYGTYGFAIDYHESTLRPTLYLKSTVKISGGNGSASSPYILSL